MLFCNANDCSHLAIQGVFVNGVDQGVCVLGEGRMGSICPRKDV